MTLSPTKSKWYGLRSFVKRLAPTLPFSSSWKQLTLMMTCFQILPTPLHKKGILQIPQKRPVLTLLHPLLHPPPPPLPRPPLPKPHPCPAPAPIDSHQTPHTHTICDT